MMMRYRTYSKMKDYSKLNKSYNKFKITIKTNNNINSSNNKMNNNNSNNKIIRENLAYLMISPHLY